MFADGAERPKIEFWHEFASSYTYLSALRIAQLARDADVALVWRPFLLGPIFARQGWNSSPFNLYPERGRYMWRDVARRAAVHGLPFVQPGDFPQSGLLAARLMLVGLDEGWGEAFAPAVFRAQFAEGRAISEENVLRDLVAGAGGDPAAAIAAARTDATKQRLRRQSEAAADLGLIGSPSFVVDGEIFWGDDRLEEAMLWARGMHELQRERADARSEAAE